MKTGDKGPADEPLGSKADFTFTLGCWAPDGVDPKGFVVFFLVGKKYTSLPRQENNVKIFPQHNERSRGGPERIGRVPTFLFTAIRFMEQSRYNFTLNSFQL